MTGSAAISCGRTGPPLGESPLKEPPLARCPHERFLPLALLACALALAGSARASLQPSAELSFRAELAPDSITVGDPLTLVFEASGPDGAVLTLPQMADSVGPFTVLAAEPPVTSTRDGRTRLRQSVRLTLFRTGDFTFPDLPLIWARSEGDTLAAYSQPARVHVQSVLSAPVQGLQDLHGVKGVVSLSRSRLWLWILLGAAAVALAILAFRLWRRSRQAAEEPEAPAAPPLPPEVAFERALQELYGRELPEHGLVKEFYAEISLIFRRYLEGRFGIPAVEETRTEVVSAAGRVEELQEEERGSLADWLAEGDMVKFAKMERLLNEAHGYAERAHGWVRRTAAPRRRAVAEVLAPVSGPVSPALGEDSEP